MTPAPEWHKDSHPVAEPHDEWIPTENHWADPAGWPEGSKPPVIRYRIREIHLPNGLPKNAVGGDRYKLRDNPIVPEYYLGEVVTHATDPTFDFTLHTWHQALAETDQLVADFISARIQAACAYFYEPDETYSPLGLVDGCDLSDDEIRERIRRINDGENYRESERSRTLNRYDLSALPFDQQRALISQIEEVKRHFRFEIIGPVE